MQIIGVHFVTLFEKISIMITINGRTSQSRTLPMESIVNSATNST